MACGGGACVEGMSPFLLSPPPPFSVTFCQFSGSLREPLPELGCRLFLSPPAAPARRSLAPLGGLSVRPASVPLAANAMDSPPMLHPVKLYVYDLSKGMARRLSPIMLGKERGRRRGRPPLISFLPSTRRCFWQRERRDLAPAPFWCYGVGGRKGKDTPDSLPPPPTQGGRKTPGTSIPPQAQ